MIGCVDEPSVTELLGRLQAAGVLAWVDGGWGVDALLGVQTRPHSDLDLVIPRPHLAAARQVLGALKFTVLRDWLPNAIAFVDADGRQGVCIRSTRRRTAAATRSNSTAARGGTTHRRCGASSAARWFFVAQCGIRCCATSVIPRVTPTSRTCAGWQSGSRSPFPSRTPERPRLSAAVPGFRLRTP